MQTVGTDLAEIYSHDARQLVELVEFYPPFETVLTPARAYARFSTDSISWNGQSYRREVLKRGDIQRSIGASANNVSITFSNLDRFMAAFALNTMVEGLRVVIRLVSPFVPDDSQILFVGRVEKPAEVDQKQVVISARDDIASIDLEIPRRDFSKTCPLDFKKTDCLGTELIDDKTTAFKNGRICNKTWEQCNGYGNLPFFQGFRIVTINGVFIFRKRKDATLPDGFKKIRGRWTLGSFSSQDDTPYGTEIPMVFGGRVQLLGIPVEGVDAGFTLKTRQVFCDGPVAAIRDLQPRSTQFPTIAVFAIYRGEYGNTGGQSLDGTFPASGWYSRTANVVAHFNGSQNEQIDEPPIMSATIIPGPVAYPDEDGEFTLSRPSDNPALVVRGFLTHPYIFGFPQEFIDDAECLDTFNWCNGFLLDDTQGEQLFLPSSVASSYGSVFNRLHSTGLVRFDYFNRSFLEYLEDGYVDPVFFDPEDPPETIAPVRYLRRRYTLSCVANKRVKATDFLNKVILPAFRGFLVRGSNGKIKIKSKRATGTTYVRGTVTAGATSIPVVDVQPWIDKPGKLALLGANAATSEVRRITGTEFSASAANAITLAASATGTLTATRSGATLTGGTTSTRATGTITIGGTVQAGAQVVATVDGIVAAYTAAGTEALSDMASMLAAYINATPNLFRFCRASASGAVVTVESKYGSILFEDATGYGRTSGEEVLLIDFAFDRSSIIQNSFKWPLGSKQTSINQIKIGYQEAKDDYAPVVLNVADYEHREQIGRFNTREIDGSGIDNFSQASRIGNQELAEEREGNFFASWSSRSGDALLIEEGDVGVVSDDSGGFINLPVRIEELKISEKLVVSFVGRRYTTAQYSDEAGQQTVSLPSALVDDVPLPPPIATDLTAAEVETLATDGTRARVVRVAWDFGSFRGAQAGQLWIRRAGEAEFSDSGQSAAPSLDRSGTLAYFGLPKGTHEVSIRTVAVSTGLTQDSGHPVVSVACLGPTSRLSTVFSDDGTAVVDESGEIVEVEV